MSSLRDSKHLTSSLLGLNRTNSASSLPVSPIKKKYSLDRSVNLERCSTNPKLLDCDTLIRLQVCSDDASHKESSASISIDTHTSLSRTIPILKAKGELKVLTSGALEHLTSVSLYPECPNTCLMVSLISFNLLYLFLKL